MSVFRSLRSLIFGGGPVSVAGWLLLIAFLANEARHHGRRWEFGRWGLPRTLVSEGDPTRYADGVPMDVATQAVVRAGMEESVTAGFLLGIAGLLVATAWQMRRVHRLRVRVELARLDAARQPAGPPRCPRHRRS